MKFIYMRSTCCVAVLNKGLKVELHLLKQLVFNLLTYIFYVINTGFKTFGATSDEIRLMAFYLKQKCIDVSLETLLSKSDEIRIITNDLQLNFAEYGASKHDLLQRKDVL